MDDIDFEKKLEESLKDSVIETRRALSSLPNKNIQEESVFMQNITGILGRYLSGYQFTFREYH